MNEILDSIRAYGQKNCPNCGAPIVSERCDYCGTLFIDFGCIHTDEPFYLKLRDDGGNIHVMKVIMSHGNVEFSNDSIYLYSDNQAVCSIREPQAHITLEFDMVR